jgi:MoaA/NifB/PqqE/SkfB family radical SAM enzyme
MGGRAMYLDDDISAVRDTQLNVYNFDTLSKEADASYGFLRFDPNNTCNLHCVYCHNHRSEALIDLDRFVWFLNNKVVSVSTFQIGCVMEPTLDRRLCDFMLAIAASPARPTKDLMLQTNGTLLNKHDYDKMRAAGLTLLSVSMDAADPETQRSLRGGMSLERVFRNISGFKSACPDVSIEFICTVTTANVDKVDSLVELGLGIGVMRYVFREVYYYPDNDVVDHERMPALLLSDGQFSAMRERLEAKYNTDAQFIFATSSYLDRAARKMVADSGYVGRDLGRMSETVRRALG